MMWPLASFLYISVGVFPRVHIYYLYNSRKIMSFLKWSKLTRDWRLNTHFLSPGARPRYSQAGGGAQRRETRDFFLFIGPGATTISTCERNFPVLSNQLLQHFHHVRPDAIEHLCSHGLSDAVVRGHRRESTFLPRPATVSWFSSGAIIVTKDKTHSHYQENPWLKVNNVASYLTCSMHRYALYIYIMTFFLRYVVNF